MLLDPLDLLARLVALIPPPNFHMLRYHGVFAAHANARSEVVPGRVPEPNQRGTKVHIKLRDTGFTTWTRQRTLVKPTAQARAFYIAAKTLVDKLEGEGLLKGRRFRLTGLGRHASVTR